MSAAQGCDSFTTLTRDLVKSWDSTKKAFSEPNTRFPGYQREGDLTDDQKEKLNALEQKIHRAIDIIKKNPGKETFQMQERLVEVCGMLNNLKGACKIFTWKKVYGFEKVVSWFWGLFGWAVLAQDRPVNTYGVMRHIAQNVQEAARKALNDPSVRVKVEQKKRWIMPIIKIWTSQNKEKPVRITGALAHLARVNFDVNKLTRAWDLLWGTARTGSTGNENTVARYTEAALLGNSSAMFRLGNMHANGEGVVKDDRQAVAWYQKAADLEDEKAIFSLGFMYAAGRGVEKDEKMAAEFYQHAADLGDSDAMYNLAVMYEEGRGVEKDEKKAAQLYQDLATICDHAFAMHNLSLMYADGRGVMQDKEKAAKLHQQVLKILHILSPAWWPLDMLYSKGNGVLKDDAQVQTLFLQAQNFLDV